MFSRWIVTNITSASVTTFLAFHAGIISWSVYCTSIIKEAVSTSEMLVSIYHTAQRSFGEDSCIHTRYCENLKSRLVNCSLFSVAKVFSAILLITVSLNGEFLYHNLLGFLTPISDGLKYIQKMAVVNSSPVCAIGEA
jgi:hypothetical protein